MSTSGLVYVLGRNARFQMHPLLQGRCDSMIEVMKSSLHLEVKGRANGARLTSEGQSG